MVEKNHADSKKKHLLSIRTAFRQAAARRFCKTADWISCVAGWGGGVIDGGGPYLGAEGAQLEDTLYGEHGGEDEVQVAQHVHELQWSPLELEEKTELLIRVL